MDCESFPDDANFRAALLGVTATPRLVQQRQLGRVRLEFEGVLPGEELYVVSSVARALVYAGPVAQSVVIAFDATLARDGGWDNLGFAVVDSAQRRICTASNEADQKVWLDGAAFRLRFLDEPDQDADGLRRTFTLDPAR